MINTGFEPIIKQYIFLLEQAIPSQIDSIYLTGSIAINSYLEGRSDIDFCTILVKDLQPAEFKKVEKVHFTIQKMYPKTPLDGFYMTKKELQTLPQKPARVEYFNEGKWIYQSKMNRNSIDAFVLKSGISLKGNALVEYPYDVDWDIIVRDQVENVNTYWVNWKNKGKKPYTFNYFGLLGISNLLEWGILGIARIYYSVREHDVVSKLEAGDYALQHVPKEWHPIILEALRIRKGIPHSLYSSALKRRHDTLRFMEYMIKECNQFLIK
ncbi:hypothetical protein Q75_00850 [Bacillus coahuilensis p1.1.43]|uniref:Adenylyltransferase AadA C-terminal domain-containing protein n=1 Tax=Bacillus coahuilensis p1.1.43 TaxID=1150625 RepID=A0A147KC70_9BACI|nr:aminoglycoside adenylyltransferase domain-containing protein [Bacillus coahuilensis]KUP09211.1 hypothetical protein Q75_00850 [Bacillus coahuilensis p1.1.43]